MVGVVSSNKMDKTIIVVKEGEAPDEVSSSTRRRSTGAHDEKNECNIGDTVRIMETRPLSRTKRWRLVNIIERAGQ